MDLKKEMDHCLYSNNEQAPDNREFDDRIALIEQYAAATAPQSPMIPLGYDGMGAGDVRNDRFAAQVADKALELVNGGIKSGKRLSYAEAVEKAKSELSAE